MPAIQAAKVVANSIEVIYEGLRTSFIEIEVREIKTLNWEIDKFT